MNLYDKVHGGEDIENNEDNKNAVELPDTPDGNFVQEVKRKFVTGYYSTLPYAQKINELNDTLNHLAEIRDRNIHKSSSYDAGDQRKAETGLICTMANDYIASIEEMRHSASVEKMRSDMTV
jgi:hypothetical protein